MSQRPASLMMHKMPKRRWGWACQEGCMNQLGIISKYTYHSWNLISHAQVENYKPSRASVTTEATYPPHAGVKKKAKNACSKSVSLSVMSNTLRPHRLQSIEFSRQKEYQSGLPFPSPRDLPNPGIQAASLALQVDSLLSESSWKPSVQETPPHTNKQSLPKHFQKWKRTTS